MSNFKCSSQLQFLLNFINIFSFGTVGHLRSSIHSVDFDRRKYIFGPNVTYYPYSDHCVTPQQVHTCERWNTESEGWYRGTNFVKFLRLCVLSFTIAQKDWFDATFFDLATSPTRFEELRVPSAVVARKYRILVARPLESTYSYGILSLPPRRHNSHKTYVSRSTDKLLHYPESCSMELCLNPLIPGSECE